MKRRDNSYVETPEDVVAFDKGCRSQTKRPIDCASVNDDPEIQMPVIKAQDDPICRLFQNRENVDAFGCTLRAIQTVAF